MYEIDKEFVKRFPYDESKYKVILLCFQYILKQSFIRVLEDISEEIGSSWENIGFSFSNIFDEDDKEDEDYFESGVCFYFRDNEQIIEYDEFYNFLKITCNIYLEIHEEDRKYVEEKLSIIRNRYSLQH